MIKFFAFAILVSACALGPLEEQATPICARVDPSRTALGGHVTDNTPGLFAIDILAMNDNSVPLAQVGLQVHTDARPGVTATFAGSPIVPTVTFAGGTTTITFSDCALLTRAAGALHITVDATASQQIITLQ